MNMRGIWLTSIAVAASAAALAEENRIVGPGAADPTDETVTAEILASMREILRAVTPEISLPKIDVALPALTRKPG
jgi:hypothetical protein